MTEQMKPSEIAWIGDIPEDWTVKRLKFILEQCDDNMKVGPFGSALSGNDYTDSGKWVYNQRIVLDNNFQEGDAFISEEKYVEMRGFYVRGGDILITTRGTIGKIAIVPENAPEGILHPCIIKFRVNCNYIEPRLLRLVFNETDFVKEQFAIMSNATTIEVIYSYSLKDVILPIPPLSEQQAIADYLDAQCAKIDSIAADLEKQIELLQKYKKSLITETVTKGLDKTAPMKDSGIEWIGEIPKNWEVEPIKYRVSFYNGDRGENYPSKGEILSDGIPFINAGLIQDGTLDMEHMDYISPEKYRMMGGVKLQENDILYCLRGSIGKNAIIDINAGTVASSLVALRATKIHPMFLYYSLNSHIEETQRSLWDNGTAQPNLSADNLGKFMICIPTLEEQKAIVEYLNCFIKRIDSIINSKTKQLETIQQHKKSLIYEYVTGKKRVKEVQ